MQGFSTDTSQGSLWLDLSVVMSPNLWRTHDDTRKKDVLKCSTKSPILVNVAPIAQNVIKLQFTISSDDASVPSAPLTYLELFSELAE
ncbi:hypothetical protein AVEN_17462-1 [Araneus ventricosus]|uniref:Uncharacterized protein n=1 Tax=Araneus ventricosus TaxID=182803 RepID=A0A4Y2V310_ARAVE|nr:hypothetical protein AVEN_17462-1 [Araneus ventricosus]